MRPDRPKSVQDYTVLWMDKMRSYLEDAEKDGDMRRALIACTQLAGALAFAGNLRLIRPKDLKYWEQYMFAKSAALECAVFNPVPEEGNTP